MVISERERKTKQINHFDFSARCHNIIEATSIVWEDKKFHESCFTCWGVDKDGVQCRKVSQQTKIKFEFVFSFLFIFSQ